MLSNAQRLSAFWKGFNVKNYIIAADDVGKFQRVLKCACCEQTTVIYFGGVLGRVLPQDVGKRMTRKYGLWYVENQQQFENRLNSIKTVSTKG